MAKVLRKGVSGFFLGWIAQLRFPYLFLLTSVVFLVNLAIPDVIPFVDEIIMGMAAILFGKLRKKPADENPEPSTEQTDKAK